MIDLITIAEKIQESEEFKTWKKENKKSYLCSFFLILSDKEEKVWQIDFYNPSIDTITSFLATSPVQLIIEDSKVFKSDKSKLNELDLKAVNIDLDEALRIVENLKMEKYPREFPTKKIIILQKTKQPTWNITYITTSLNILNIKIDASSGDLIEEKLSSVMSLKEQ